MISDDNQERDYNFFFRYGSLAKDEIILDVGFIDKCNFKVTYDNNECDYSIDDILNDLKHGFEAVK